MIKNHNKIIKCLTKIISVCKNRGLPEIGNRILAACKNDILNDEEIKNLQSLFLINENVIQQTTLNTNIQNDKQSTFTKKTKAERFANKLSFLQNTKFEQQCSACGKVVEYNQPSFIKGKKMYHVICAIETYGDEANSNIKFNKWNQETKI